LDEEVFMFDDDVFGEAPVMFNDDVFGEAPARELGAHLKCQCNAATASTTVPAGMTAVQVEKFVIVGTLGFDFSSRRRLEAVDEDFLALSRKLLTVEEVKPHIQAGLQETIHKEAKVTKCEKEGTTDKFDVTYEIACATAAEAETATAKLVGVAKAGASFDALKAAVVKSAKAASVTLALKGPPTVVAAPATTTKTVTVFVTATTTTADQAVSGACPPKAMGVLMGLAVLAAAAN